MARRIRRIRRILIASVILLAGCSAAPERIALEGVRDSLAVMRSDWVTYVGLDASLDEAARADRIGLWADTERLVRVGLGEEEVGDGE